MMRNKASLKVYHGYGHTHNLVVYGHVFKRRTHAPQLYSEKLLDNIQHLMRLFMLTPYPGVTVTLKFYGQEVYARTERDGFFKFEWSAEKSIPAGLHMVEVFALDDKGNLMAQSEGKVYIPHITQYAIISDVDDTVMISHSAKLRRKLRELFIKNPRTRKTFPGVQRHYELLAKAHTEEGQPNPFFYVSSSEWNLYEYLKETFRYNKLPEGTFLLNTIKTWKNFFLTGATGHDGKLLRVMRIIDAFPKQKFIFFGDNSQQDPDIYAAIAKKYAASIVAIYIRNVRASRAKHAALLLERIERLGIYTCLFKDSVEAEAHSRNNGLIIDR